MKDRNNGGVDFSGLSLVAVSKFWGIFSVPSCAILKLLGSAPGSHWLTARLDGLRKKVEEVAEDSIASTLHAAEYGISALQNIMLIMAAD